ncbi:hypothetical protein [Rhodococcus opacus]|uniref:hypothetical protein n=1 Tax=Rhodococcus opacus TaxID=37919 RepID=UPI000AC4CE12|nr:hypothetical protein [Rhodococcus opacus]
MNLKKTATGAVIAVALGFGTLGLGAQTANADPGPSPIPGSSVPDVVPPPGQLGQLPFFPPPGQLGQLPFVPPPGHWDKPWKWLTGESWGSYPPPAAAWIGAMSK